MKKILFFSLLSFLMSSIAYPCDVTDKSGNETDNGTLLYLIMNQATCPVINITVPYVEPLDFAPFLYAGTKLVGNGQTLKLKSGAVDDCVINIVSSKTSKSGTGGSTLENVKVSGSSKKYDGVCVFSNGNTLSGVTVTNADRSVAIAGDSNKVSGGKFYSNNTGININGGDYNLLTKSLFCSSGACNSTTAVNLTNSGNQYLPYPTNLYAIVDTADNFIGLVGVADASITKLEIYESGDEDASGQGQGSVYKSSLKPIFFWDYNTGADLKWFYVMTGGLSLTKKYTIISQDGNNNTSEFSVAKLFADPDDQIIAGPDCFDIKDKWHQEWFDTFINGGDPWADDPDRDSCTNGEEDPSKTCDPKKWNSNPAATASCKGSCCMTPPVVEPVFPVDKNACHDFDNDGISCSTDNCLNADNPLQEDSDNDGSGDVCDNDQDSDGILDDIDNCVFLPNPDQNNADGDLFGNMCDEDDDNDGLTDYQEAEAGTDELNADSDDDGFCDGTGFGEGTCVPMDNCPTAYNQGQKDVDGDGIGDECDDAPDNECFDAADSDGDGTKDISDNCPRIANFNQTDTDNDGNGDGCDFYDNINDIEYSSEYLRGSSDDLDNDGIANEDDGDRDGDGIANESEMSGAMLDCADIWDKGQRNSDFDSLPNACDSNDDNDAVSDADESKSYLMRWWDYYQGDVSIKYPHENCDSDGDGVINKNDNCPGRTAPDLEKCKGSEASPYSNGNPCWNVSQANSDADSFGDVCDNCADDDNEDQDDFDGDKVGDICDNCMWSVNPTQEDVCKATPSPPLPGEGVPFNPYNEIRGGGTEWSQHGGCAGNLSMNSRSEGNGLIVLIMLLPIAILAVKRKILKFEL